MSEMSSLFTLAIYPTNASKCVDTGHQSLVNIDAGQGVERFEQGLYLFPQRICIHRNILILFKYKSIHNIQLRQKMKITLVKIEIRLLYFFCSKQN